MINWSYNKKYTDKFRMDHTCGHSFVEVYEPYLTTSKRILEVGTQQGGFIKFCKDQLEDIFYVGAELYLYPKFGENNWVDQESFNDLADDFYVGDAFCNNFLDWINVKKYKNTFDLVIDDGPHTLESQTWLIQKSDWLLNERGVFVCEDVDNLANAEIIKSASPFPSSTRIWDGSQKSGRWDDICVIIDLR